MALINYLTNVHFADRILEDALAEEVRSLGIQRLLIVTDRCEIAAVMPDTSLKRVRDALPGNCQVSVFVVPSGHSGFKATTDVCAAFIDGQCDGYLGLGSEAALTLARRAAHFPHSSARRPLPNMAARPSVIAIPTSTACVGLQPVLVRPGQDTQPSSLAQSAMLPDLVLCDPTLTLGLSESATAAAGMDALTHCIEAYLGTTWNPPADGIALDGIRRASANLDRAVHKGRDLDARREMMAAALDAGLAAQKGLGAIEALSHALAEEISTPVAHGYFLAALMPAVFAFNAPAIKGRFAALRNALQDSLKISQDDEVVPALLALGMRIKLPSDLRELRLDGDDRARIARRAAEHPSTHTNPRHVTTADYVRMLEHAS